MQRAACVTVARGATTSQARPEADEEPCGDGPAPSEAFRALSGGVTVILQRIYSDTSVVLQWSYSSVTVVLQSCYSGLTMEYDALRMLLFL
jgi:hypothetical protein